MSVPKRILVVDDEPLVCEALGTLLRDDGHYVVQANSGQEALSRLDSDQFDLVFTDFKMPAMTGAELARAIHDRYEAKPIVMITAFPPRPLPPEISTLIVKPFDWDALRTAIDECAREG